MNISAQDIVTHMEKKIVTLRQGLANEDEKVVHECAASIEAYCQLLKGITKQSAIHSEQKKQIVRKPDPPTQLSSQNNQKETLGNLLDF